MLIQGIFPIWQTNNNHLDQQIGRRCPGFPTCKVRERSYICCLNSVGVLSTWLTRTSLSPRDDLSREIVCAPPDKMHLISPPTTYQVSSPPSPEKYHIEGPDRPRWPPITRTQPRTSLQAKKDKQPANTARSYAAKQRE